MRFFVGVNWDFSLLEQFDEMNQRYAPWIVGEVYGSFPSDPIGQVRERERLQSITESRFEEYVEKAHSYKIDVCYAMNSPVVTPKFINQNFREIMEFVSLLESAGVDHVIVASPALAVFLKGMGTNFGMIASTVMNLRTVGQIQKVRSLFSRVCPSTDRNRDIGFLMKANEALEVEVLVNEMCLYQCPWRNYHYVQEAMSNAEDCREIKVVNDDLKHFPINACWGQFTFFPSEIIKSRWVRPEDVEILEEHGIKWAKLSGRTKPTEWILNVVNAYLNRCYVGNLIDLFPVVSGKLENEKIGQKSFFIDNQRLNTHRDAFLKKFLTSRCEIGCVETHCDFCERMWNEWQKDGIARITIKNPTFSQTHPTS